MAASAWFAAQPPRGATAPPNPRDVPLVRAGGAFGWPGSPPVKAAQQAAANCCKRLQRLLH
eukprot:7381220-Alexandrium_andersonii.AAC.1